MPFYPIWSLTYVAIGGLVIDAPVAHGGTAETRNTAADDQYGETISGPGLAHPEDPRPAPEPVCRGLRDVPGTRLGSLRVSARN